MGSKTLTMKMFSITIAFCVYHQFHPSEIHPNSVLFTLKFNVERCNQTSLFFLGGGVVIGLIDILSDCQIDGMHYVGP